MEELKNQLLEEFKKSISEVIKPLKEDIKKLQKENEVLNNRIEERLKNLKDGKDGKDGRDGRDGKDGSNGLNGKDGTHGKDGASAYEIAVSQGYSGTLLEFAQKQFGKDGRDGKDFDSEIAKNILVELFRPYEERLKSLKDGKDGKDGRDGRDGKDGSNGLNGKDGTNGRDGASAYEIAVSQGYSGTLLEFAQKQFGKDGRDGKDGLGFDDIKVEFDGQRTINLKFEADGNVKSYSFDIPAQIYKGVYQSGVKYKAGDTVTDNGSLWSCLEETTERPISSTSGSWQLAVKQGRAGAKGESGDSAYDLAVKGGFTGSQKDWLAEIRRGRQV